MKYELLKRTAIALFVGSVISTYSVAEGGKISGKSSFDDVANAVNKNDENISKIKTDVSALAKSLKGDDQNPGLLDALEEANKGLNENKEALALKADKATVDAEIAKKADKEDVNKIKQNVSALAKSLQGDAQNPGLLDALEEANKGINENKEALALKADKALVDEIDEDLGDLEYKVSVIADKAANKEDLGKLNDAVETLRDDVNNNTDILSQNSEDIAANKEVIEANRTDIDANKAEIEKIKNLQGYDSLTKVENIVSNKADQDYVEGLEKDVKINTSDIKELSEGIRDNILPAIEANRTDIDANKADVDTLKNKVAGAAAAVDLLTQNIALNKTNIESKADQDYVEGLERDVKANTSDIKELSEGIRDNILPAIEANRTDIDANKADVDTLKNKVAGAAAAVDLLTQNIALNKTNIESKADQDYVEGLEQDVKINTQDIKDLSVGIRDHVLPAIEANRSDIDKNASHITDIRNKQALQNARLDNHGERIEANKAAIGDLARATNEAVTNLGNAVSGLDEDLAGTQDAVAENRKDIDKNASRITDTRNKQVLQNARLDNHGERIDANKAAIATNVDKIATNKAAIATNADKIATNADKIATNVDKIATNKAAIATNADKIATKADKNSVYSKSETDEKFALKADNSVVRAQATDISNLRTDVNAHKVDIDKLRTDVNVHTKRLDHLDNRVNKLDKDLKRGLAAQAALTGLFQPYTVGKANFTAAVGGYKSQTAVAVGTGYRYNQNIATKAGVAFTQGGGVTYNAGVNFEW